MQYEAELDVRKWGMVLDDHPGMVSGAPAAQNAGPSVGLYQLGLDEGHSQQAVARVLLSAAFHGASRAYAMNIPASDPVTLAARQDSGFREQVAQFQMRLRLR